MSLHGFGTRQCGELFDFRERVCERYVSWKVYLQCSVLFVHVNSWIIRQICLCNKLTTTILMSVPCCLRYNEDISASDLHFNHFELFFLLLFADGLKVDVVDLD